MAEQGHTVEEFETIMQGLVVSILGLDVDTESVRISWPTEGMPAWGILEDVVFLQCFEVDDPYNRPRENTDSYEQSPSEFLRETSYTSVMQVNLILYGPTSGENAKSIKNKIFYPEYQLVLSKEKIYLIHDVSVPRRVPDYWEGSWWKRYDMSMKFNMLVVKSSNVPAIDSIEVAIYEGDEGDKIAEINNE